MRGLDPHDGESGPPLPTSPEASPARFPPLDALPSVLPGELQTEPAPDAATQAIVDAVVAALRPGLRELVDGVDKLTAEVKTIGAMTGNLLERSVNHGDMIDALRSNATHLAEGLVGLKMAVHEYQQAVEETVDKTGAKMHARVEKLESWRAEQGGASDERVEAGQ